MVAEQRRISFDEFARTLDAVFDEVAERQESILVQRGGRLYRLAPATENQAEDIWADYNAEKVLQAWEAAREARIFEGVDVEQLKADIKAARGQDSIGRPGD
jgi:hypothetical protein